MPGVNIIWEPEAEADLVSILEYIAKDNIEAAIYVTNEIYQQVSMMLAPVSRRGKKRKGARHNGACYSADTIHSCIC